MDAQEAIFAAISAVVAADTSSGGLTYNATTNPSSPAQLRGGLYRVNDPELQQRMHYPRVLVDINTSREIQVVNGGYPSSTTVVIPAMVTMRISVERNRGVTNRFTATNAIAARLRQVFGSTRWGNASTQTTGSSTEATWTWFLGETSVESAAPQSSNESEATWDFRFNVVVWGVRGSAMEAGSPKPWKATVRNSMVFNNSTTGSTISQTIVVRTQNTDDFVGALAAIVPVPNPDPTRWLTETALMRNRRIVEVLGPQDFIVAADWVSADFIGGNRIYTGSERYTEQRWIDIPVFVRTGTDTLSWLQYAPVRGVRPVSVYVKEIRKQFSGPQEARLAEEDVFKQCSYLIGLYYDIGLIGQRQITGYAFQDAFAGVNLYRFLGPALQRDGNVLIIQYRFELAAAMDEILVNNPQYGNAVYIPYLEANQEYRIVGGPVPQILAVWPPTPVVPTGLLDIPPYYNDVD